MGKRAAKLLTMFRISKSRSTETGKGLRIIQQIPTQDFPPLLNGKAEKINNQAQGYSAAVLAATAAAAWTKSSPEEA